jgi:uncharacterized protein
MNNRKVKMTTNTKTLQSTWMFKTNKQHRLIAFFSVAFLISWAIWIPGIWEVRVNPLLGLLAGFAPSISGAFFTWFEEGNAGLRKLAGRLSPRALAKKWIILPLVLPPLAFLFGLWFYRLLGGAAPEYLDLAHVITTPDQWYLGFVVFLYVFIFTAVGEEIGWRGYALPRMIESLGAYKATFFLGILWFLWHLPLFWVPNNFHQQLPIPWFTLQIMASTVLYTWLHMKARGKLLPALLFHTAGNAAVGILPVLPMDLQGSTLPLWVAVAVLCGASVLLLGFDFKNPTSEQTASY